MEGEIETEEIKEEVGRRNIDSKLLGWLHKHELDNLVNNLQSYPHDLTLDDLCDNYKEDDLRDLCNDISMPVTLRVKFMREILALQTQRQQMKTQIKENPRIQIMLDGIERCYTKIIQQSSQIELSGERKTKKDQLEKDIKREAKWLIDKIKVRELLLLEEINQKYTNADQYIERNSQRKMDLHHDIMSFYNQFQDFLMTFRNKNDSIFYLDLNTSMENIELQIKDLYQRFKQKCNEFLEMEKDRSNILTGLPRLHCDHNGFESTISKSLSLNNMKPSKITSGRYTESREAILQGDIERIKRHLSPRVKAITSTQINETKKMKEKEKKQEGKKKEKKVEGKDCVVIHIPRTVVVSNNDDILGDNNVWPNRRLRRKLMHSCLTLLTTFLWVSSYRIAPPHPAPVPLPQINNLCTIVSVAYRTIWSDVYKGHSIALQNKGLRAINKRGFRQTVRAEEPLIPGHKYEWNITFHRGKQGSTLGNFYFIGVVSEDLFPYHFQADPTNNKLIKAYGIDNSPNYYYSGKGFERCPFKKEHILSGDTVTIVAVYISISQNEKEKKGELRLKFFRNGNIMKPKNAAYSIIIQTNNQDWFPAVSLWDKNATCDISFN